MTVLGGCGLGLAYSDKALRRLMIAQGESAQKIAATMLARYGVVFIWDAHIAAAGLSGGSRRRPDRGDRSGDQSGRLLSILAVPLAAPFAAPMKIRVSPIYPRNKVGFPRRHLTPSDGSTG